MGDRSRGIGPAGRGHRQPRVRPRRAVCQLDRQSGCRRRSVGRVRPSTGIVATNDKTAILALDADVVLHSASKAHGFDTNTDDIIALLETGQERYHGDLLCALADHWATVEAATKNDHSAIRIRGAASPGSRCQAPESDTVPSVRPLADALGVRIDRYRPRESIISTADVHHRHHARLHNAVRLGLSLLPNPFMDRVSRRQASFGRGGVLDLTPDIPDWNLALDGHSVRIRVDGVPNIDVEVRVDYRSHPAFRRCHREVLSRLGSRHCGRFLTC